MEEEGKKNQQKYLKTKKKSRRKRVSKDGGVQKVTVPMGVAPTTAGGRGGGQTTNIYFHNERKKS